MKKGFTLVELSIVLVIIGILMGMTVKGKSLIESARIKSDMATVNKVRTAVAAYAANADARFPTESTTAPAVAKFSRTNLIDGGYLTIRDFDLKYGATPLNVSQATIGTNNFATASRGNDIVTFMGIAETDRRLGCLLDAGNDDSRSATGDVRLWQPSGTVTGSTTELTADNCKSGTLATPAYSVLVF